MENALLQKLSYRTFAFFVIISITLTACGRGNNNNNKLIGKWEHIEPTSGITVMLEFTRNKLSFSAAGVAPAETSYTFVDEATIKVRNPDTGVDVETSYSIDGDKLTIAFSGEDNVEFTRVK
jgi:hypothetical protein